MKYLYNGIELPALPSDWDKSKHPYALITKAIFTNEITAYFLTSVEYITNDIGNWSVSVPSEALFCKENAGAWDTVTSCGTAKTIAVGEQIVWCNHGILNSDGTLYLTASEPVPVTQPVPIISKQTAFLIGKQLGRRIFR